MFRTDNEVTEEKIEPALIFRSQWMKQFNHAVALSDGSHLAAIIPAHSLFDTDKITIWNIQNKTCILERFIQWKANAVAVQKIDKKNDLLLIADSEGKIHQLVFQRSGTFIPIPTFQTMKKKISALSLLEDGSLAIAHDGGSVSIWDLVSKKEIKTFIAGQTPIHTMDTYRDNSVLLGNESRCIFIYDIKASNYLLHTFGTLAIKSLVALPDNTIILLDSDKNLTHYDPTDRKILNSQKVEADETSILIPMPNGWIGCTNSTSILFFEPSWVQDYINDPDSKELEKLVIEHLPAPLTKIVTLYANITLFNPPKMPSNKNCVLECQSYTRLEK